MGCKSINNCTSASCNNLPLVKSPRKSRIETSNTPAKNAQKKIIIESKNVVNEFGNNSNLGKDKS